MSIDDDIGKSGPTEYIISSRDNILMITQSYYVYSVIYISHFKGLFDKIENPHMRVSFFYFIILTFLWIASQARNDGKLITLN